MQIICHQQQQELKAQLEELNLYRQQRFGRSAEPHPPQGEVFNEAEAEADVQADADTPCDDGACEPDTEENTTADAGAANSTARPAA